MSSVITAPRRAGAVTAALPDDVRAGDVPGRVSLLPEPGASIGSIGQLVAELSIEAAFERRAAARAGRAAADGVTAAAQQGELAAMRESADAKYDASLVDAGASFAAGGLGVLGLAASSVERNNVENRKIGAVGDGILEVHQRGGAEVLKGSAGLVSAGMTKRADDADRAAKAAGYAASSGRRAAEEASEDDRAARESIRRALDFAKEYDAAQAQSVLAALHRA